MKTKILFIIDDLMVGGAEKVLYNLLTGLDRSEFLPSIITLFSKRSMGEAFEKAEIPCRNLGLRKASLAVAILKLRNVIVRQQYDIIQLIRPVSRIVGSIAATGLNSVRIISRYDSMISHEVMRYRVFEPFVIGRSDIVLTPSRAVMLDLENRMNVPRRKQVILNNGIGTNGTASSLTQNASDKSAPKVIGTIGNISWKKGYMNGLHAITKIRTLLPDIQYQIIGRVNGDTEIGRRVVDWKLNGNVKILGEIANVYDYLNQWDIYFQPSLTEGFGLSILEAMACGKPIVAANVGGIPEIIEHNVNGLLTDPNDGDAMADALLNIINDMTNSKRLAENAQKTAKEKFDVRRMIADHESLYRNVTGRAG